MKCFVNYSNNFFIVFFSCALTLAIRLYLLGSFLESPFFFPEGGDRALYYSLACNIADFNVPQSFLICLPLYPFLLALLFIILQAKSLLIPIILNLIFEVITTFFVVNIVKTKYGKLAAILAGALYALLLPAAAYSLAPMPISAVMCLTAFILYLSSRWDACLANMPVSNIQYIKQAMFYGLLLGIGTLLSGNFLVALFLMGFLFLIRKEQNISFEMRIIAVAIMLFIGLALFSITGFINKHFGGSWHLGTVHSGMNLYLGNNPNCNGYAAVPETVRISAAEMTQDFLALASKKAGKSFTAIEANRYWQQESIAFWQEHPFEGMKLILKKLLRIINFKEFDDCDLMGMVKMASPAGVHLLFISFGIIEVLALFGIIFCNKIKITRAEFLISGSFIISMMITFVTERYRLPLVLSFIPMATTGIIVLKNAVMWLAKKERIKSPPYFLIAKFVAFIVSCGLIFYPIKLPFIAPQQYVNYALYYLKAGNIAKAEEYALKARQLSPSYFEAALTLANTYAIKGDFDKAYQTYLSAIELNENDERVLFNIGLLLFNAGRNKEAITYFNQALIKKPDHIKSLFNLADLHLKERNYADAQETIIKLKNLLAAGKEYTNELAELEFRLKNLSK